MGFAPFPFVRHRVPSPARVCPSLPSRIHSHVSPSRPSSLPPSSFSPAALNGADLKGRAIVVREDTGPRRREDGEGAEATA